MLRYTLYISFKDYKCKSLIEDFKTLKEALINKDLIDDTVKGAYIKDNSNGKLIILL